MKKFLGFLLLSLCIFLFRYSLAVSVISLISEDTLETGGIKVINDSESEFKVLSYTFSDLFYSWDSARYLEVASKGYVLPTELNNQFSIWPILPLYPAILSIIGFIPIDINLDMLVLIASLYSTVLFAGALFFIDKLMDQLWLHDDRRYFVFLSLIFFPGAYFFTLPYSESLFLFLTAAFFFYLFRRKYTSSALIMSLAMLTSPFGFILIIPFLYLFIQSEKYNEKVNVKVKSLTYTIISFVPIIFYYLYLRSQNMPIVYMPEDQNSINNNLGVLSHVTGLISSTYSNLSILIIPDILVMGFVSLILIITFIKFYFVFEHRSLEQNALFIYSLFYFGILLSIPLTMAVPSIYRYVSTFLPLFLFAPIIFPKTWVVSAKFMGVMFVFVSLQTLFYILFLIGVPIYSI